MDLVPLAAGLRRGDVDLFDYLERLESLFAQREGEVHAFVPEAGRFERLRREAEALYRSFPSPDGRPELFGVPVGLKDIFHADGFETRAGSELPADELAGPEATCVTALRSAGALVMGKAVSTQFAYFGPGPTRNPHRSPDGTIHTPGGSSSGSAAAVAAGLCPLTLGTQTIGSITRPAAFCGVTGYKPSYDRVSRAGVIPLAPSLDHMGPFARDVAGVRLAAGVLAEDFRAPETGGRRPVLGVPDGPFLESASAIGREHFEDVCRRLASRGFTIRRVPAFGDFEAICDRHYRIVAAEAARVHGRWYRKYRPLYHPKTVDLLERGLTISDRELDELLPCRDALRRDLTARMDEHGLDLWISPSAPGPAPEGLDSTGDPVMNLPWSQAGLPTLGLPSGVAPSGLPLGLQLAGRWWRDEDLLAWGEEIEAALAAEPEQGDRG